MVGAKIKVGNQTTLICNIYAPNGSKTAFLGKLKDKIIEHEFDELMILGDFNGVLNPEWDKKGNVNKKNKDTQLGKLPRNFIKALQDWELKDAWRAHHEGEKDFTYFSNRHNSWSRIDMAWMTPSLILKVSKIKITPRYISDHCPLEFTINKTIRNPNWRLNGNLIKSEEDIKKNKKILKEYFDLNNTEEIPIQTIWDASKAVMRGHFIQQNAQKNKMKNRVTNNIEEAIKIKEKKLKLEPTNIKVKQDLEILRKQKIHIELEETEKKLRFIKQQQFQNANKPGKWLAWKIRKKKQAHVITEITTGGVSYMTEQSILTQFKNFYSKLYSKDQIDKEKISQFISKQKLAKISDTQRELLNKEITEKEIKAAINKIDGNKAPGPDGLSGIYYKVFAEETTPYLKKIMNSILENQKIPDSWKYALITTIPKEGQDLKNVKNYRPISLLNSDYKIFTNILAERLKDFLKEWIKEEQTGFLPKRQMKDNVREIINIIEYYEFTRKEELALLTIDMEKAFDNLNWDFFKLLIQELDMGYKFTNAINQIYDKQEAKIKINSLESKSFRICKGTRQGCPLSPLLFIFSLEILLNNIREDPKLKGAKIKKYNYKVRAYADDLICIIEDPIKTIQNWLSKIREFGEVSGLNLNIDKTMILPKNMAKKARRTNRNLRDTDQEKNKIFRYNVNGQELSIIRE
uniref:Reverse transcriptase domain-containing protein n=1 Tax=Anolis carolinensis TaxID=28377 RepID=A0A803TEA6_ANOCA